MKVYWDTAAVVNALVSKPVLIKNLRSALREAIEMNRREARSFAGDDYEEAPLKA